MEEYKKVKASDHFGFSQGDEGQELRNGEIGVDPEENILVVCCSNCGDYSRIDLNKVKEANK